MGEFLSEFPKQPELNKADHASFIKNIIEETPFITEVNISEKIQEEFGIDIRKHGVSLFMKQLGLTYKRAGKEPYRRNSLQMIRKRFEYATHIIENSIDQEKCIEPAFKLEMKPTYRAIKGKTRDNQ